VPDGELGGGAWLTEAVKLPGTIPKAAWATGAASAGIRQVLVIRSESRPPRRSKDTLLALGVFGDVPTIRVSPLVGGGQVVVPAT
jgi:hypothetical protein